MLFESRKSASLPKIYAMYIAVHWTFANAKDGSSSKCSCSNFDLSYSSRSGRPATFDNDMLRAEMEANPCQTVEEIWSVLTQTIHLRSIGKVCRARVWVHQNLSVKKRANRSTLRNALLERHPTDPFFDWSQETKNGFCTLTQPRKALAVTKWITKKYCEADFTSKKGVSACLVGCQWNWSVWSAFTWTNCWRRSSLWTTGSSEPYFCGNVSGEKE